jgi:hypothetical protein
MTYDQHCKIVSYIDMTEDQIRKAVKDNQNLDWDYISQFTELTEQFIEEFENKVNWDYIFDCQIISEDFKLFHSMRKL